MSHRQLLLGLLEPRPAQGREDFILAPCNAEAMAMIDRWPAWPGPTLALVGPKASGKSHLAAIWRARTHALAAPPEAVTQAAVPDLVTQGALVIDDADRITDEEAFFHLLNFAQERGVSLLLTARTSATGWPVTLPDLATRLAALPQVAVSPPDEPLLSALIVKLLADRQLGPVPADVVSYIVARMERSYEAAERIVAGLDQESLARKTGITLGVARAVVAATDQEL